MAAVLSHRDCATLQQTIVDVYELRTLQELREVLPELMLRVVPADSFTLAEVGYDFATQRIATRGVYGTPEVRAGTIERMERTAPQHPFTQHVAEHGPGTPMLVADFLTRTQLRRTELYNEYFRFLGVEQHLATAVLDGAEVFTLNLLRGPRTRAFSERDRSVLQFMQPHFAQARRNAVKFEACRARGTPSLEHYDLTPREHEVALWISRGKTNPEIAIILGSSPRTVEKHVEKVLEKLGVENRVAAAVMISESLGG